MRGWAAWSATGSTTSPARPTRRRRGSSRARAPARTASRSSRRRRIGRWSDLAFGEFALASLSHRPALGWDKPLSAASKYALTYLFAQSEFGLLCPVNMTDSLTRTIRRFADDKLLERYLPGLLAQDADGQLQGAMFMTERFAGSDVGATETRATPSGDHWLLTGDKWFCSNADADLALVLARPEGAPAGTAGLGLFLMPRTLPSGAPNRYRIVRLKEKLGTRAMASGEITLEGAAAWLVGDLNQGFKQMTEMVNQSRLSNAVRSAGMMRRAVHEALTVALGRRAFGRRLIDLPLVRRQLIKMILPAEEALSVAMFTADCLDRADAGEARSAGAAPHPDAADQAARLPRRPQGDGRRHGDARRQRLHRGMDRAAAAARVAPGLDLGRHQQHHRAGRGAGGRPRRRPPRPGRAAAADARRCARRTSRRHGASASTPRCRSPSVPRRADGDPRAARQAATGLYHLTAAALFAHEAHALGDAVRLDLARLVLAHKLGARDPLAGSVAGRRRRRRPRHRRPRRRPLHALSASNVVIPARRVPDRARAGPGRDPDS